MKIQVVRDFLYLGKPRSAGDCIDVPPDLRRALLATGQASEVQVVADVVVAKSARRRKRVKRHGN